MTLGRHTVIDRSRARYERLRAVFLESGSGRCGEFWQNFTLFGFFGLFQYRRNEVYVVQVYQVSGPRWSGRNDPEENIVRDVFSQLVNIETETIRF